MAMPAEAMPRWTPEAVRDLMERGPGHWPRYELIDGELLVTPAPRLLHDRALMSLLEKLLPFVKRESLGRMSMSPADMALEPGASCSRICS